MRRIKDSSHDYFTHFCHLYTPHHLKNILFEKDLCQCTCAICACLDSVDGHTMACAPRMR